MPSINAHEYNSQEEALAAIATINTALGIPVDETSVTQTYAEPIEQDGKWYVFADDITLQYLLEPTVLTVTDQRKKL